MKVCADYQSVDRTGLVVRAVAPELWWRAIMCVFSFVPPHYMADRTSNMSKTFNFASVIFKEQFLI